MSIEVKNLSFAYDQNPVLRDVSFSAAPGDFLCVLGPNGTGKSTLFRCMLGLQRHYAGNISVDGQALHTLPAAKLAKKIAYIPQYHTPAFNYSVFHTVLMGTTSQFSSMSSPGKSQVEAVEAALEQFGIAHLHDRGCAQISGGERQLALVARAVVQKAKILVMDEPTANLDYGNQLRVMEQIRRLSEQGYTIILSTHNPEHALLYSTGVLVLLHGAVLRFGTPDEVMTSELLREVYRVDVRLETIQAGDRAVRVCVPLGETEGN